MVFLRLSRDSLPPDELKRYETQYKYIRQICTLYEEDPSNFGQLFTLIQEVRAFPVEYVPLATASANRKSDPYISASLFRLMSF